MANNANNQNQQNQQVTQTQGRNIDESLKQGAYEVVESINRKTGGRFKKFLAVALLVQIMLGLFGYTVKDVVTGVTSIFSGEKKQVTLAPSVVETMSKNGTSINTLLTNNQNLLKENVNLKNDLDTLMKEKEALKSDNSVLNDKVKALEATVSKK